MESSLLPHAHPSPPTHRGAPLIGQYLVAAGCIAPHQVAGAIRQAYRQQTRLGLVLLKNRLVSPVALADALVLQALDRQLAGLPIRYLGERLLAQRAITPDQLAAALYTQLIHAQHGRSTPLGQLLLAQGVIDQGVLEAALEGEGRRPTGASSADAAPPPSDDGLGKNVVAQALVLEDDPVLGGSVAIFVQQLTRLPTQNLLGIAAAQRAARRGLPRLFITDRRLPDGDGLALAAQLRAQSEATAIVLMTADTSPALLDLMEASQLRHFVAKPFELSTFARVVAEALRATQQPG